MCVSSSIFLFAFSSKLYMLFPVTLWYTHTCHVTHLPISLQLSTEGGGGPFYKELLYSSCLVNTSNSTCFKVCCIIHCLAFMLPCTCNAFSCKVFDGASISTSCWRQVSCTKGAGLLNHVTTHEFAGVLVRMLLTVCLRAELYIRSMLRLTTYTRESLRIESRPIEAESDCTGKSWTKRRERATSREKFRHCSWIYEPW